jgi:hypothetical protein
MPERLGTQNPECCPRDAYSAGSGWASFAFMRMQPLVTAEAISGSQVRLLFPFTLLLLPKSKSERLYSRGLAILYSQSLDKVRPQCGLSLSDKSFATETRETLNEKTLFRSAPSNRNLLFGPSIPFSSLLCQYPSKELPVMPPSCLCFPPLPYFSSRLGEL